MAVTTTDTLNIQNFPNELLLEILKNLNAKELVRLSITNKLFRNIILDREASEILRKSLVANREKLHNKQVGDFLQIPRTIAKIKSGELNIIAAIKIASEYSYEHYLKYIIKEHIARQKTNPHSSLNSNIFEFTDDKLFKRSFISYDGDDPIIMFNVITMLEFMTGPEKSREQILNDLLNSLYGYDGSGQYHKELDNSMININECLKGDIPPSYIKTNIHEFNRPYLDFGWEAYISNYRYEFINARLSDKTIPLKARKGKQFMQGVSPELARTKEFIRYVVGNHARQERAAGRNRSFGAHENHDDVLKLSEDYFGYRPNGKYYSHSYAIGIDQFEKSALKLEQDVLRPKGISFFEAVNKLDEKSDYNWEQSLNRLLNYAILKHGRIPFNNDYAKSLEEMMTCLLDTTATEAKFAPRPRPQ